MNRNFYRPVISKWLPVIWPLILVIFLIHSIIRFGSIWNEIWVPVSMMILWPLPWLISDKKGRQKLGFKTVKSKFWVLRSLFITIGVLSLCVIAAELIFGNGRENWLVQHAFMLKEASNQIPENSSLQLQFIIVTVPALIFSPFAEEFLYRGYIQSECTIRWGSRTGNIIQASAFALIHLAHYGLNPFQPILIALWIPSIFLIGLTFGWMVKKSGSIWIAVFAHAVFNLGLNVAAFLLYPEILIN